MTRVHESRDQGAPSEPAINPTPPRTVELRRLRYFVAVADEMSITKASKLLRLAQSSLTKQIKNLEEELHVTLFKRSK